MKKKYAFAYVLIFTSCVAFTFAQQGEWTWMSGSNSINGSENYGTQGIPSVLNHPQALYEACEWTDTSGMFWLYGGSSPASDMSNLWNYNPTTYEWTWVKGPGNGYVAPTYGTQGISDPANTPGARVLGVITWVGKDGHLWLFGGYSAGPRNDLWSYDISTNEWTWEKGPTVSNDPGSYGVQGVSSPTNLPPSREESAASWTDTAGNLWFFGGSLYTDCYNDLWKYDPVTNEWTWMKGTNVLNAAPVYGIKGVSNATNNPGSRNCYAKWNDGNDNLYLFGGDLFSISQLHNDVWKYSVAINEWVWISGTNLANDGGNVSTQCSPDINTYPSGRRENRASWVDLCGKFWTYGGSSQGSFYGCQSDLWKFDPLTLEWSWVSGPLAVLQSGSFGTQYVSSPTNQPSARAGNNTWTDQNGNLWMFGGTDETWANAWNDLWRYVPDPLCGGCNNQSQVNFSGSDTNVCEKFCISFSDQSSNNPISWLWLFPGGTPASSTDQNPSQICYQNPGTYDVTLITTNANGNDTLTLTNYITVYPTPPFPVITQNGYTLTSSPAVSYQWQLNNVDIPGATNQSYDVQQSGYYTVFITDQNGCVSSTTTYILIEGIEDLNSDANVLIYPNPSDGSFIVELLNGQIADEVRLNIYSTLGQVVFSSEEKIHNHFSKAIDASVLSPGVYFLEVSMDQISVKKKLVISK